MVHVHSICTCMYVCVYGSKAGILCQWQWVNTTFVPGLQMCVCKYVCDVRMRTFHKTRGDVVKQTVRISLTDVNVQGQ